MKVCGRKKYLVRILHTYANDVQTSLYSPLSPQRVMHEHGQANALLPSIFNIYWVTTTVIMDVDMMNIPVVF